MDNLAPKCEVESLVWRDGKVAEKNFDFARLSDHLNDDTCVVWMDLSEPDHSLLRELAGELSIDANAVEDSVAAHERPKVTRYRTYKFVTAYSAALDTDNADVHLARVSAFVFPNALITVRTSENDHPPFDMTPVRHRWDDTPDLIKLGVGGLMHGLLDVIVDGHFEAVQALDDAIEALEDDLFDEKPLSGAVQRRTFALRKAIVRLRRVVLPMREVVGGLHRRDGDERHSHHWDPLLDSYFDDLYDHVLRVTEWTESLRDLIGSVFETNLSLADARMNAIMKKLTAWAAIIAVPTAVTGFYGQNVPYPGFGHHSGFIASSVIIVLGVGLLYVTFRRKDWL